MLRSLRPRWILAVLGILGATGASAAEPKGPAQENFLNRAVFADGLLWLLSDSGELSTIKQGEDARRQVDLGDRVLDICTRDGQLKAATCERDGCTTWTLREFRAGKWEAGRTIKTQGDELVALVCAGQGDLLLTSKRVIKLASAKTDSVALSDSLHRWLIASVLATSDYLFVGSNKGEWGGGLQRIDLKTGKIKNIAKNATGELCAGPLNTACDPVNGIALQPGKPGCVAAAIGLVHFFPHGRIVEVCKDKVRRLYFKPYETGRDHAGKRETRDDEPFSTVAFFGLQEVHGQLWAAGIDGIYKFEADGKVVVTPLPKFDSVGKVAVSFELPEVVLVLTSINRRMSISGAAPMLVPR